MSQDKQFISASQAQAPLFAGIDLGGTNIKIGVVDDLGRPLCRLSIPTEPEKGPEDAARRMGEGVVEAARQAGLEARDIARVGLGSPGTMDIPNGRLVKPVNLKGWDGFPLRDRVAAHCGLPVTFQNDANAAAYGEFWVGKGRDFHSMVLFTLGTGIGCGIIVGDLSIDGENSHGAECGHIIIDCSESARLCGCGQRGHLEAYASATAVVKRTCEALESGRPSSLRKQLDHCRRLTPKIVAREAEAGDALSLEIVAETARYIAVGIVNLMHTIDPNGVLLGGAMTFGGQESALGRQFLGWIREEVGRRAFTVLAQRTVIDFAGLGGDAGYIGAAGMARLEHRDRQGRRNG
jgi:glucokinase